MEVLKKKADFSGSFLVAGETGGDQETTGEQSSVATGRLFKGMGCPGLGVQGRRGRRGFQPPWPTLTQERAGCPLSGRVRDSATCVSVCERQKQTDSRGSACVAGLSRCVSQGGHLPGPFWFLPPCFPQPHVPLAPHPSKPSGSPPGTGLMPGSS